LTNTEYPTIPGYKIERLLGQGGMGAVYLAEHEMLHVQVALKVTLATLSEIDEHFAKRFIREARATAALRGHPNIIVVYDAGEHDGRSYMAMEYVRGGSLKDRLASESLNHDEIRSLITSICKGLSAAHAKGYVHRDVKPDNVLLEDDRVLLTDFGIVKALHQSTKITATLGTVGSPRYMSPEQIKGHEIDRRSDLYSLGVMLFEMLESKVPFDGENHYAIHYKHLTEEPPPLSRRNADFQRIVTRLLEKDPDNRYDSADEVVDALNATSEFVPKPASKKTKRLPAHDTKTITISRNEAAVPTDTGRLAASKKSRPLYGPLAVVGLLMAVFLFSALVLQGIDSTRLIETTALKLPDTQPGAVAPAAGTGAREQTQSPPEIVSFTVVSDPVLAKVRIMNIEQVYFTGIGLPVGTYDIEVSRPQFQTVRKSFTLEKGNQRLVIELAPERYGLTINTKPAGANVRILNSDTSYAPDMMLPPGIYDVLVSKEHFGTVRSQVAIIDKPVSRTIELGQSDYPLVIRTQPAGAQIVVSGKGQYSEGMRLPAGNYPVHVWKAGYADWFGTARVGEQGSPLSVTLRPGIPYDHRFMIAAGSWKLASIDSKPAGFEQSIVVSRDEMKSLIASATAIYSITVDPISKTLNQVFERLLDKRGKPYPPDIAHGLGTRATPSYELGRNGTLVLIDRKTGTKGVYNATNTAVQYGSPIPDS